ncbi:MAG: HEAT repeat domain-containing protein [Deltaproteobacteria bacterium]|nr:HEAT repeat domain-containing protein [Deltaproteobacteria bacterium]MBW1874074.1 HEAT repeat domain-containing protein [Deltaproteobacteria bacterium]MBW2209637.1 HEAT repeat domain-containing protein [Deltaproteobacteria bacterium]MBW2213986.1 HEAT repeat domain-containing protein [Deltaproteobacteria bacterium]MBW2627758.1 HEAT repeat domain-containing protein [Deltaproteobacteria bacterium]
MTGDRLEEAFHSADPDVRRQAVHRMSLRPQGTPLTQILSALSDADWRVRREAISLAAQTREKDALIDALLVRVVETENIGLRNAAIEVLGVVAQGNADKFATACQAAGEGMRKFVVEAMGKTRDPRMIDHLELLIQGSDANVAAAAVEALVCIGGARAEGLLKERLSTPHLFLRISILEGLTRLGTRVPWDELRPAVEDAIVRRISAELLGRTGEPQALEFLLELATDASPQTSSAALRAIAELAEEAEAHRSELIDRLSASKESFRHALHEALLHGDTATRQGAAYLAVLCRDENSLEAVLHAIADDVANPETVEALWSWGPALIEPLLMQRRSEPRVWAISLEVAAELSYRHLDRVPAGTRDRIRSLIERDLSDTTDAVRAAAAESLRWWGDPRDCRALVECLSSPSHQVRAAATSALEALAKRVPAAVEEALERADLDGPGGADIAHVLSRLDSDGAVDLLKRGLHSCDPRTRRAVVQALAMADATDMAQLIGYAVADEDLDVQIAAVRTLGQMSTVEANAPLSTALDSPFPPIRAEAALALGRRDASASIPRIRALLQDKEPVVIAAALDALAWLKDAEVAAAVDRALSHADDEVFQAGLRAAHTLPARDAERLVSRGLQHSAWNVRMLAIKLLLDLDTERTRTLLTEALASESDSMVKHAIESGLFGG